MSRERRTNTRTDGSKVKERAEEMSQYFLRQLAHAVEQRRELCRGLSDQEMRLLDDAIITRYCDVRDAGLPTEARALLAETARAP